MRLFYSPNIANEKALSEDESRHAIKVLRLKEGDKIEILDGVGATYIAEIIDANAKKCEVNIVEKIKHPKPLYSIEIVVSPTKNADRIEWFLEKATEIGISKLTLIQAERTERKKVRIDRLEKIAISAMKQSKTHFLPEISELKILNDVLESLFDGQRFIAHCIEDEKQHLMTQMLPEGKYQILIGPEGDFTQEEIDLAISKGFKPITLGENRLRTETAALYACTTASIVNA